MPAKTSGPRAPCLQSQVLVHSSDFPEPTVQIPHRRQQSILTPRSIPGLPGNGRIKRGQAGTRPPVPAPLPCAPADYSRQGTLSAPRASDFAGLPLCKANATTDGQAQCPTRHRPGIERSACVFLHPCLVACAGGRREMAMLGQMGQAQELAYLGRGNEVNVPIRQRRAATLPSGPAQIKRSNSSCRRPDKEVITPAHPTRISTRQPRSANAVSLLGPHTRASQLIISRAQSDYSSCITSLSPLPSPALR